MPTGATNQIYHPWPLWQDKQHRLPARQIINQSAYELNASHAEIFNVDVSYLASNYSTFGWYVKGLKTVTYQ